MMGEMKVRRDTNQVDITQSMSESAIMLVTRF